MLGFLTRQLRSLTGDRGFAEILGGSIWALGAQIGMTLLSMASSIFIARVYGAELLGTVALIASLVGLVTVFTVLGTKTSILRLIPEHLRKHSATSAFRVYRKSQYLVLTVSFFTGTLLYLGSEWIAGNIFSKPHLSGFFAIAALFVLVRSLMDLNTSALRGMRLVRTFAFMQLLPELSRFLILVCGTYLVYHAAIPVYSLFASWLIAALFGIVVMQLSFQKRMSTDDPVEAMSVQDILSVSLPMLGTASMAFVIARSGIIVLGAFRPEAEVAYFSVATSIATLNGFALGAIKSMAAPKFSELYHGDQLDELFRIARKSAKLIFWTTIPLLAVLTILGQSILALLYGDEFAAAYPALVVLMVGQFVNAVSGTTGMFMNMTGQQVTLRNIMVIAGILNLGVNLALVPPYGLIGAAVANAVSIAYWNLHILLIIKRRYGRTIGYLPFLARRP